MPIRVDQAAADAGPRLAAPTSTADPTLHIN